MGKVIGGGMPMAAFGARREIMEKLSPLGPVTRPARCRATHCHGLRLKTLELISRPGFHAELHLKTGHLMQRPEGRSQCRRHSLQRDWQGGLFGFISCPSCPRTTLPGHEDRRQGLQQVLPRHAGARLLHFALALYEAGFVGAAHSDEDIDRIP